MALDKFENESAEVFHKSVPIENLSDHELIEATKRGDEAAFGEIMRRYRSPITNYVYRFLNDYEEAVDLAQETFVPDLKPCFATRKTARRSRSANALN
jgi:RNA polymerase sigma-70 factor (ECF subfamily)